MPSINLLPWREEQRSLRQKEFVVAVVGASVVGALVVLYGVWTIGNMIDHQQDRNTLLKNEIAELDKQIEEILGLEAKKERLLARMEIIEQLQRSRPEIVHIFDQLVQTLPEGVHLKSIKQTGPRLELKGAAQSSTRVSAYMRAIDASDWLADPQLEVIQTVEQGRTRAAEFTVYANQISKAKEAGVDEELVQ